MISPSEEKKTSIVEMPDVETIHIQIPRFLGRFLQHSQQVFERMKSRLDKYILLVILLALIYVIQYVCAWSISIKMIIGAEEEGTSYVHSIVIMVILIISIGTNVTKCYHNEGFRTSSITAFITAFLGGYPLYGIII